jgi:hypothetical protein
MEKDSSVAIMKIRSFNKGDFRPLQRETFEKWTAINQNLNSRFKSGGGRLNEIVDLYSYLADSTLCLDKSEVVSNQV